MCQVYDSFFSSRRMVGMVASLEAVQLTWSVCFQNWGWGQGARLSLFFPPHHPAAVPSGAHWHGHSAGGGSAQHVGTLLSASGYPDSFLFPVADRCTYTNLVRHGLSAIILGSNANKEKNRVLSFRFLCVFGHDETGLATT